ncbi:hypothetical protein [Streptomyces sp. PvR034]|uniref:hypothetical protein n=1 Tax=Streptomyces sp. PvR034 TaxID=3156401 RepID=UPI00339930BC
MYHQRSQNLLGSHSAKKPGGRAAFVTAREGVPVGRIGGALTEGSAPACAGRRAARVAAVSDVILSAAVLAHREALAPPRRHATTP